MRVSLRSSWVVSGLLVAACGGSAPAVQPAEQRAARAAPAATVAGRCTPQVDVRDLLARHERAYGSHAALVESLPGHTVGTLAMEGKSGPHVLVLDKVAHRTEASVAGLGIASGQDTHVGAWTVGGPQGVRENLSGQEAIDVALEAWLWRREYVGAVDSARPKCTEDGSSGARVELAFARPDLGNPTLSFDLASAALLGETHTQPDGAPMRITFETWSDPDQTGVRWPTKTTYAPAAGQPTVLEQPPLTRGAGCVRLDRFGHKVPAEGAACLAPSPDRVGVRWPAKGVVRVPMTYLGGELLVKVRASGRDAVAFLDSGAGITVVEAGMPLAQSFVSSMDLEANAATQKVRIGIGELPSVDVGDLHVENLPAASVPIPALEAFGDKRPEVVLGYTFFALGAVRVDFAKNEVAFAKSGEALVGKNARAVPIRAIDGKLVADVRIEDHTAPIALDTGNAGGMDLFARWASPHGLPGDRKTAKLKGRFGAGTAETEDVFFRMRRAALGPIAFDDTLAQISEEAGASGLAGLAGNQIYARCDAVVFDHPRRTLWLEGDCNRPIAHARFGWRLARKDDATHAGRPWVIGSLFPGGSADKAGLREGDRVLEIGGRPATLDVAPLWKQELQAEGTKIPVVVAREGKTTRVVMELAAPLR